VPARLWTEFTTEDLRHRDMSRTIAVLPVAAVEQHGPHLPLGTDSFIMEGYLARALPLVPEELDVVVLPIQTIGKSNEHLAFPGTLTLSAEGAIKAWMEIGLAVHLAGCGKLVLITSHGGNSAVNEILARELRVSVGLLAVTASWHRLGYPEGLFPEAELKHGIHGGAIETSLMLAFRPDLVRREALRNFAPRSLEMEERFALLRPAQPAGFGWMAQDLHPEGAMGDASAATPEKGEAAADHGARRFVELLGEVDAFDLDLSRD
jgi:creatinine amidohydrolase